ncbi:MAG: hypothetical protein WC936_03570 [Candidatus Nanoarchaeia archaeon]
MVTAADVLLWTDLTIPEVIVTAFSEDAVERLIQDGVNNISGTTRTKALCYLVAASYQARGDSSGFQSENIGGYSYSKKVTKSSVSHWIDLYHEILPETVAGGGSASTMSGSATRVDTTVVALNWRVFR